MVLVKMPIKDQVYNVIKERILNEEIKLGEKINMLSLSKELGVSNTPIREALSMLERDGLIEFMPNVGPCVFPLSQDMFRSIDQAMVTLLCGAYDNLVHEGKVDLLIDNLTAALDKQKANYKDCNHSEFAHLSMDFDACFIMTDKNDYLLKMYNQIYDIFYLVVSYNHTIGDFERNAIIEEHQEILDAVKAQDHQKTRELLFKHYDRF